MIAVFASYVVEYLYSRCYMLSMKDSVADRYQEFISDEVKRKWRWRRQHEGEFEFWKQVVYGVYGARCSSSEHLFAWMHTQNASQTFVHAELHMRYDMAQQHANEHEQAW